MIKKQKSHGAAPAPQTAQLDSIERLLGAERYHEAHAKAQRLGAEFPDHSRLRDLRIQAAAAAGEVALATLLAEEWSRAHPNSQPKTRRWIIEDEFSLADIKRISPLRSSTTDYRTRRTIPYAGNVRIASARLLRIG